MHFISQNQLIFVIIVCVFFLFIIKVQEWKDQDDYDNSDELDNILQSDLQFKRTDKRNYFYSKSELDQTNLININPGQCNGKQSIVIFVHSVAHSSGHYYERRQALRSTWATDARHNNISVYFVIGLHNNHNNNRVQNQLEMESKEFNDIIQFGFVDHYYNLTLKAISILKWVNTYCSHSKIILKTDDDVIVNVDKLIKISKDFNEDFVGYLLDTEKPYRNKDSIWYMPEQIYPQDEYPIYMRGSAYLMNSKIVGRLLAEIGNHSGYIYDIDDMFITGIIAAQVGITRRNSFEFHLNSTCDIPVCDMYSYVVLGECDAKKTYNRFWEEWKTSSVDMCQSDTVFTIMSLLLLIVFLNILLIFFVIILLRRFRKISRRIKYYSLNLPNV